MSWKTKLLEEILTMILITLLININNYNFINGIIYAKIKIFFGLYNTIKFS